MDWTQLIAIADSAYEWTYSRTESMKLLIELSSKCARGYISFYSLGSFLRHKSDEKIQWLKKVSRYFRYLKEKNICSEFLANLKGWLLHKIGNKTLWKARYYYRLTQDWSTKFCDVRRVKQTLAHFSSSVKWSDSI